MPEMRRSSKPRLTYSIPMAARFCGVAEKLIRELVAEGMIGTIRLPGGTRVIPHQTIEEYARRSREEYPFDYLQAAMFRQRSDRKTADQPKIDRAKRAKSIGTVYLISDGEHTKIGFTTRSVQSRLASLQTGHPKKLKVVGSVNAIPAVERKLHAKFAHLRANGEWFRHEAELAEWIKRGCPIISAERGNIWNIKVEESAA